MRLPPSTKHLIVTLWLPISLSLGGMTCSNAKKDEGHPTRPTNGSRTIKPPPKNNANSAKSPPLPHNAGSSINDSPSITPMSYGDGRPSSAGSGGSSAHSPTSSVATLGPPTPQSLAEAQAAVDNQAQQALHCGGTFGPCLQDSWKSLQAAIIAAKRLALSDQQLVYEEAVQAAGKVATAWEAICKAGEEGQTKSNWLRRFSSSTSEGTASRESQSRSHGMFRLFGRAKGRETAQGSQPSNAQERPPRELKREQREQAKKEKSAANTACLQAQKEFEEAKIEALEKLKALPGFTSNAPSLLQEVEEALEKSRSAIAAHEREIAGKGEGGGTRVHMRRGHGGCG